MFSLEPFKLLDKTFSVIIFIAVSISSLIPLIKISKSKVIDIIYSK